MHLADLIDHMRGLDTWVQYIYVALISMLPVVEQRGAIPVGINVLHLNPILVMLVSFLGSLVPVPFILLFFKLIFSWMEKIPFLRPIYRFIERKLQKNTPKIEKYKEAGLITFVAIPLPTTGLWTGSAVASFIGLDFKKSLLCTALGGSISAIIITILSTFFGFFQ